MKIQTVSGSYLTDDPMSDMDTKLAIYPESDKEARLLEVLARFINHEGLELQDVVIRKASDLNDVVV